LFVFVSASIFGLGGTWDVGTRTCARDFDAAAASMRKIDEQPLGCQFSQ
jgi:hypothetical protein